MARRGDDSVRLSDAACQSELVLARVEPGAQEEYKAATARFGGPELRGLLAHHGRRRPPVYEDGDRGIIPMQELKPELQA
ncbi:hypothetical protein HK414_07280 [Ramlibacter terrae]|uniref:Uncharacterized protein n=1 Tax=Ramlibacter terrae TaxID=2732511 RepID=A0ABX6P367_9BURK|nr:hypothetical protein HK414_07280 [Ramlibacter terrae]